MKKKQVKKVEGIKMNHRQRIFADGILAGKTQKEAAEEAGYAPGPTAEVTANRLMKSPSVKTYIDSRAQKIFDKYEITQEKVMKEYFRLAFFDPRKFYNHDGTMKQITELDDDTASALVGIEIDITKSKRGKSDVTTVKIKMPDRRAALDSICRVKGWSGPGRKDTPDGDEKPKGNGLDLSGLTIEELRVAAVLKRKINAEHL